MRIGIIGGSGMDDPDILKGARDVEVETPYGAPASALKVGSIAGVDVVLLARHGRRHQLSPTIVPNRANLWALKEQGCTHILATTAVGSLREEIGRGDFVIPDQLIDFTRRRDLTFHERFDNGPVHAAMAEPFSMQLRSHLVAACADAGVRAHDKGTLITIEGPRFSTRAESRMFRAWGADIINMSVGPECILASELHVPYAVVAMSTDYDCWKEDERPVTWEQVLEIFGKNVASVQRVLIAAIKRLADSQLR